MLLLRVVHAEVEAPSASASASAAPTAPPKPVPVAPAAKGAPQTVEVGLYLQNIPEIDIKTNSFTAEFYLWFLWAGDLDPTLTFELTNAVNPSELTKTPIFVDASGNSAPDTLPDGRHLQQFHVYGRFGHPFPLSRYPFDDHDIAISLEDGRHANDALVHVVDEKGSAMRPDLVIPGWNLSPMRTSLGKTRFGTTFGDPRSNRGEESYSHVEFKVHIDRPVVGIISKTVVPIALIILITFGAFFCQPIDIDARLCLTITALISAVALQLTAATELPPTGSLLLLDKIYILSYVAILAVTFLSIAANRAIHRERAEQAAKIDRLGLRLVAAAYFGGLAMFLLRAQ
jgi:hypothetical protein